MQVSNVTTQDAVACAQLIRALQVAKFDNLSGQDMEAYMVSKKWLAELGMRIAQQLPGPHQTQTPPPAPAVPSDTGMRITKMGPLGGSKPSSKTRTNKKKK